MTNDEITQALQYLVGSRYVPALCACVSQLTDRSRVHSPYENPGQEPDPGRITINIDDQGKVSGFSFG